MTTLPIPINPLTERLEARLGVIDDRINVLEGGANELADLRAERARIVAALKALAGDPIELRPKRAERGRADEIVADILLEHPNMAAEHILAIAREQPNPPSESAIRRAIKRARPNKSADPVAVVN